MVLKVVKAEKKKAIEVVPLTAAESLRIDARFAFRDLQKGWYTFAKKITEIQDTNAFMSFGYETFKDFCLEEYPDVAYSVMIKYTKVIGSWGTTLEQRMLKSPEEPLPSYDTCYDVAIAEDKIPKEEIPKLRKSVLERNLTRTQVRDQLKEFRRKPKVIPEETKKRLDKELKNMEKKAVAENKAEADGLEVVQDIKSDTAAIQILARLKLGFDNLEAMIPLMKDATPKVVELAMYLRDHQAKNNEIIDVFLTSVEELAKKED